MSFPAQDDTPMTTQRHEKHVYDGKWKSYIEVVRSSVQSAPRSVKIAAGVYLALTSCAYGAFQYRDGKAMLYESRVREREGKRVTAMEEYNLVVQHLRVTSSTNFWEAAFFPVTIMGTVVPNLVMALNKREKESSVR